VPHFEADASNYFFGLSNCGSWANQEFEFTLVGLGKYLEPPEPLPET
jgi:hypothetical protein